MSTLTSSIPIDILPWEAYLQLGSIDYPLGLTINQSSLAHRHFFIGYLSLHSFMYDTAQEAFQLAIDSDPALVEAHIGRLLGHKQVLWSYTNRSGALEVWNNTWSLFDEYNVSLTSFQSIYLNTVYQWYLPENITDGEENFLNAMLNLTKEYLSNNDAHTLLGLAYLNKAERESIELKTMETPALLTARKILQTALVHEPEHPGCLHYLIHAFDIPRTETALQAVPYAHKYGQVVITSSHAQHMPVHIWTRIGAWTLAQMADAKAIEVSLLLCIKKQQLNNILFNISENSPLTLSTLIHRFNLTQSQNLLYCDQDNRVHSQEWLVYSYIQTGQYKKSINELRNLVLSNQIYPFNNYYLPFIYGAQAYIVTSIFFWAMYDKENNREIFIQSMNGMLIDMNSNSIHSFNENISYILWREALARYSECIRLLLLMNNNNDSMYNTTSVDEHLTRMSEISTNLKSNRDTTEIRIMILISQINALRWCFNGSMKQCLIELDKTTQMESSIGYDYNRPYILHIRTSELFALYLLITHKYYYSLQSTYLLDNSILSIDNFPSFALHLFKIENQTDPHRAINLLGMARAYAQMRQNDQANQIYEKFLRDWSDSTFSSTIDKLVIKEATDYLLQMKINQIKNNGSIRYSSILIINILLMFFYIQNFH